MGYKKYSPFLKSIKVLILLSFIYFTTRLDAIDPRIPVTLKKFDYHELPVYCKASTKHFTCKDENGRSYCLRESMKCKIKCSNDAELNCPHSATECKIGHFKCNSTAGVTCLPPSLLCDGNRDCINGDDELPDFCGTRECGKDDFACKSPGHCIHQSKICDGNFDCVRPGLNDKSDEENCTSPIQPLITCNENQFKCADATKCIHKTFYCDTFNDCDDGSDEPDTCKPKKCPTGQFLCDGRCAKNSLKCDGNQDCKDGLDEVGCYRNKCPFSSETYCQYSDQCVPSFSECDGFKDCRNGEDEICRTSHHVCASNDYWTCKSGLHCVHKSSKCDGMPHCPDGSDESDCPTKTPVTASASRSACANGMHLCNGTSSVCVSIADVCNKLDKCPLPDNIIDDACNLLLLSLDPCAANNGGCQHECVATVTDAGVVPECRCRPGYKLADTKRCVDANECSVYGTCSQYCLNTIGSYTCSCRPGYSRHGNRCHVHGAAKILYSTADSIVYIDTDTMKHSHVASVNSPKYIAYDRMQRKIFFHTRDLTIESVSLDGSERQVLQREIQIDAIAYDWTRQLMFYTVPKVNDQLPGHVGVMDTRTGYRSRLLTLDCPRGLAVHPKLGRLFVSIWCGSPGIYSFNVDGSGLVRIVGDLGLPGHLAMDTAASPERLFWVDIERKGIFSATLEGKDLRANFRMTDKPVFLFDLSILGDRVFWNDLKSGTIGSVDKLTGTDYKVIARDKTMRSVSVYHSLLQPKMQNRICACQQHICIAGSQQNSSSTCLCDETFTRDPVTGMCVNGTRPEKQSAFSSASPTSRSVAGSLGLSSGAQNKAEGSDSHLVLGTVGTTLAIVIGAMGFCLVAAALVACFCWKHQDTHSMHLYSNHSFGKQSRMPKIDSRTPLTECEIDMDTAAQTSSSNSSNSSRF